MPYVRAGRGMRFARTRGMGDDSTNYAQEYTDIVSSPVPADPLTLPFPYVSDAPSPTPTPASSSASSLDQLFANLAIGGENILGKVVAPAYQTTCGPSGCTTTITGPTGSVPAGVPGASLFSGLGSNSNLLLIGGGLLLAVLVFGMGRK